MNLYIASRFDHTLTVRWLRDELRLRGHDVTYDWTMNDRAEDPEALRKIGLVEFEAVQQADAFVLVLPAGKSSHVELGIALATNRPIYLCMPDATYFTGPLASTFYHIGQTTPCFGTKEDWLAQILANRLPEEQLTS